MKTTLDLPERLVRRAKAAAAPQGRPLRDLVAEAISEKLAVEAQRATDACTRTHARDIFKASLQELPDGTLFNPQRWCMG